MSKKKETNEEKTFGAMRTELLDELLAAEDFTYDASADALYRQYRDAYTREGRLAAEDVAGRAATLTGGYGNSYASGAAAEAYNSYLRELNDRLPQLEQNAYGRYTDRRDAALGQVQLLTSLDKEAYARTREEQEDARTAQNDAVSLAFKAAQVGDYSRLQALGVDVTKLQEDAQSAQAVLRAEYGDYSGLRAMGVDVSKLEKDERTQAAVLRAQYGDYSGLQALGVDLRALQEEAAAPAAISVSIQNGAEEAYYNSGYYALVSYLDRQIAYGQLDAQGKQQILAALTGR